MPGATTVWVVNRVHHHTANGWSNAHPALHTSLAQTAQAVLFVGDLTNGGTAVDVNLANFTGAHADLSVGAFTCQQGCRRTGGTYNLCAFTDLQLDAVNDGTHRDVADWQSVADTDWRFSTVQDGCTDFQPSLSQSDGV